MKPLLVGMANPYGGPPGNALIPDPEYCAGWNLCHKILQLSESEYYERFDRVNLCHRDWKIKEARERASSIRNPRFGELLHEKVLSPKPTRSGIVLLGAKVCSAFKMAFEPYTIVAVSFEPQKPELKHYGVSENYVILPHPSGLSRAWHEPGAFERARAVLREAGVL